VVDLANVNLDSNQDHQYRDKKGSGKYFPILPKISCCLQTIDGMLALVATAK
jgi:hypothetical protein